MTTFLVAAIQMDTTSNQDQNLSVVADFIGEAAKKGAKLIALPETMAYLGRDYAALSEAVPGGKTATYLSTLARKYGVYIEGGSLYERNENDPARPYNTTFLLGPDGAFLGKYSKLHPFDVVLDSGVTSRESSHVAPGHEIVTVKTAGVGTLGFGICYDLRFGELFRLMAFGAHRFWCFLRTLRKQRAAPIGKSLFGPGPLKMNATSLHRTKWERSLALRPMVTP